MHPGVHNKPLTQTAPSPAPFRRDLEAAHGVAGDVLDAEKLAHASLPGRREVGRGQPSFE